MGKNFRVFITFFFQTLTNALRNVTRVTKMLNVQIPLVPTAVRVRQGLLGMEQRAKVVFLKKLLNCTQMRKGNSHWELALPHHF